MKFPSTLSRGRLLRRYKRFLADIELEGGTSVTATCPNTGSMLGLAEPGMAVWVSESTSPTRKYRHTWEMVETGSAARPVLVGINTGHPNRIVAEAIRAGRIPTLEGYETLRAEVKYGAASRIDLLLEDAKRGLAYVEIKNVHLSRKAGLAEFPDSRTERGVKHLGELSRMVEDGHRAVMLFLIQRKDVRRFNVAGDIDPAYEAALAEARRRGVEVFAYRCRLTPEEIVLDASVVVEA